MDVRTVLAPVGADRAAIRAARSVAEAFDAALIGVGAVPLEAPVEAAIRFMDEETLATVRLDARASLDLAKARFRGTLAGSRLERQWREAVASPTAAVLGFAAGADLIVTGRSEDVGAVVMAAGAPVLLAPSDDRLFAGRTVLVGWKDTREARRALGDALPFLKRATSVTLLAITEEGGDPDVGLDAALARLSRHGIAATAERLRAAPGHVGDALLARAERHRADLIVAGAYGHSRLREWAFGGVTRTLLHHAPGFVLLSR